MSDWVWIVIVVILVVLVLGNIMFGGHGAEYRKPPDGEPSDPPQPMLRPKPDWIEKSWPRPKKEGK